MTKKPSACEMMGILKDIQAQVESERAERIKLEAEVEKARKRAQQAKQRKEEKEMSSSSRTEAGSRRRRRSLRNSSKLPNDKETIALQAQVDGYRRLMDVLSQERPAIASAMLREKQHQGGCLLPLKLVRLLELIPWSSYVEERVDVQDDVYEWQRYDPIIKDWRGDLPSFPDFFHALPTNTSPHGDDSHPEEDGSSEDDGSGSDGGKTAKRRTSLQRRGSLGTVSTNGANNFDFPSFLAGLLSSRAAQPQNTNECDELVLTNANLTQRFVLNAKDGYPLPNPSVSGTWRWIGRWVVDRPANTKLPFKAAAESKKSIISFFDSDDDEDDAMLAAKDNFCDEDGWSYAREASHFVLWDSRDLCRDSASSFCSCNSDSNSTPPSTDGEPTITACLQCQRRRKPLLRRRKWTRQRVLVDYPLASESTLEYLRVAAHNATMRLAANELAERLLETTTANNRVQNHWETIEKTHKVQLDHYQSTWENHEEQIKELRYGKFNHKIQELACNQDDILPIIADPNLFTRLQNDLRQSGAITNAMLQQGIHFYIMDHVRPVHGKSQRRKSSCDLSDVAAKGGQSRLVSA